MSETILKSSTVKVMLSYDYNHFESSILIENDEGLTVKEIDEARKTCARLCDKAIRQYKAAKNIESQRIELRGEKRRLELEVDQIKERPETRWSPEEKAKVKALQDGDWELSWDYDDDMHDQPF
jgi:hypothetical protein